MGFEFQCGEEKLEEARHRNQCEREGFAQPVSPAALSLSIRNIRPPHCGQVHMACGGETTSSPARAAAGTRPDWASSCKQSGSEARRLRWASSPKWRMRT